MQLISIYNKGIRFLLYVIHVFSKYTWIISSKEKDGITITKPFQMSVEMILIINQTIHG